MRGSRLTGTGAHFAVPAPDARGLWLCLFDEDRESARLPMTRGEDGWWRLDVAGVRAGQAYGPTRTISSSRSDSN